jgi:hypothetical protein
MLSVYIHKIICSCYNGVCAFVPTGIEAIIDTSRQRQAERGNWKANRVRRGERRAETGEHREGSKGKQREASREVSRDRREEKGHGSEWRNSS